MYWILNFETVDRLSEILSRLSVITHAQWSGPGGNTRPAAKKRKEKQRKKCTVKRESSIQTQISKIFYLKQ